MSQIEESNTSKSQDEKFVAAKFSFVDRDIREDFVNALDQQPNSWQLLLCELPPKIQRIFHNLEERNGRTAGQAPRSLVGCLVDELMDLGATVSHFITWLEPTGLDDALMVIKPDEPLMVMEQPAPFVVVAEGGPLSLHCRAAGFPRPSYRWTKNGQNMPLQDKPTLLVERARLEDSGEYKCRVEKVDRLSGIVKDQCYSRSCNVNVHKSSFYNPRPSGCAPRMDLQPVSPGRLVPQGSSILLNCRASSEGPVTYQWFKDDAQIPDETSEEILLHNIFPDNETHAFSWSFHCCASNQWGTTPSKSITIMLDEPSKETRYTARDKVALLFANESYQHLKSFTLPSSDVATLSGLLKMLGFRVMSFLDLTLSEMRNALKLFCEQLEAGVYGLFYFAGHGFEEDGQSYMQPADASNDYLKDECLCVDLVAECMQQKDPAFCALVLDMCRERPPPQEPNNRVRHPGRMYQMNQFKDIIFCYATSFLGEAVEVESHANGLFMQYLKKYLMQEKSMFDIIKDVSIAMGRDPIAQRRGQVPWVEINIWLGRTLRDPIENPLPRKSHLDKQWQTYCVCPDPRSFESSILNLWVTFELHKATFCNAMVMRTHIQGKLNGEDPRVKLKATFNLAPGVTMESDHDTFVAYIIPNLQRIPGELSCELSLTDRRTGKQLETKSSMLLQLGRPAVAALGLAGNMFND